MCGIYGFAAQSGVSSPMIMLSKMLEAIKSPGPFTKRHWTAGDGNAGLGVLHPARIGDLGHFAQDQSKGVCCVIDGIIYRNMDALGDNLVESHGAARIIERYLKSGIQCPREFSGSFNVALWDDKTRRLVLANDKLGHRPLFWTLRAGVLVFASMLARIMGAGVFSPEIDIEGLADLLSYNYVLGQRTLFKDVHVLPPASVLTYEEGRVNIQQYWRLDHVEPHGCYDKRRLDELEDTFEIAVKRSIRPDIVCSIGLTGGLDSRCILAAAVKQRLSFVSHTTGQPNGTDSMLAKEVAAKVGVQHILQPTDTHKLGEWLVPMVLHLGGIMATLQSHPCQTLHSLSSFDAIVSGIGGEFARGFWVSPLDLGIRDLAAQKPSRLRRQMLTKTTQRLEQLWKPEFQPLGLCAPRDHLGALLLDYSPYDSPVAAVEYLYLNERCRKFLNKGPLIILSCRDVYFPYLDHQWIESIAAIPISERVTNRIQVDLIKRLCPAILDIPHEKNLIPLSAPSWRISMIKLSRRARRKASKKFRIIRPAPIRVRSHDYRQLSRGEMRTTLIKLLYNPDAAFRTYLRWRTVEPLLDQHFSGEDNWDALVAALAVFEIANKLWVTA